jgi:phosphatidate cytidylyltransferase
MSKELKKRIITSFFLVILLTLMFFYTFVLIISLILIALISWIEFYGLISKIFKKKNIKNKILKFAYKSVSLLYLSILVYLIILANTLYPQYKVFIIYPILISIMSDIGGLTFGRMFKGKKLTRISPKKTISGSIGSFIFSLSLIPFFLTYFPQKEFHMIIMITIFISFISQLGDLFISYLKRLAKVKDTSDLLPGHGGVLDRVDGMVFAIPVGLLILNYI